MAKFYGKIGYGITNETSPGVWTQSIVERYYYGDVLKNNRRIQASEKVNEDISISNEISIIADPYAMTHFYNMKYVEFMGVKWIVSNVDVQHPRLILSLGGLYNGKQN